LFDHIFILGQKIMLGLSTEESESAAVDVTTTLVSFSELGGVKPAVVADNCVAAVQVQFLDYY
jgi:hypothetical protein